MSTFIIPLVAICYHYCYLIFLLVFILCYLLFMIISVLCLFSLWLPLIFYFQDFLFSTLLKCTTAIVQIYCLISNFFFTLHIFSLLSSYYNFREINNIGKIRLCFSFTVEHDHEPFEDHRPVTCNSFTDGTTDEAFHHKTVGQSYIHK